MTCSYPEDSKSHGEWDLTPKAPLLSAGSPPGAIPSWGLRVKLTTPRGTQGPLCAAPCLVLRMKPHSIKVCQVLIHVVVWQKPTQYCNAIIHQLKIIKKKKKSLPSEWQHSHFPRQDQRWLLSAIRSRRDKQLGEARVWLCGAGVQGDTVLLHTKRRPSPVSGTLLPSVLLDKTLCLPHLLHYPIFSNENVFISCH